MLDMSWGEVMVIGGVALIVIGPKDLPKALRTVGQMTAKVRRLAGEFQTQFNEAMREADLEDVRKDLETINRDVAASTATGFNPIQTIRDELKGAVEGRPAVTPVAPETGPLAWGASPSAAHAVASSPETAIADAVAEPGLGARLPAEEVGAPPAIVVGMPVEARPAPHSPIPPLDVTGPGMEPEMPSPPILAPHRAQSESDRA